MALVARQMCDTSSDALRGVCDIVGDGNLFDSSLIAAERKIGLANYNFAYGAIPLEKYSIYQTNESYLTVNPAFPISIIDTSSETLSQERIGETIAIECMRFCESHNLLKTFKRCLQEAKEIFKPVQKIQAEFCFYQDDDTDDVGHIVIRLEVESERNIVRAQKKAWLEWFIGNIDPEERSFFNLVVRRDS